MKDHLPERLTLRSIYRRRYPQGSLGGHIVGYTGRTSGGQTKALQNNDLLWPDSEGREGLEQTFDDQLRGKAGELNLVFDKEGKLTGQRIASPPQPGYNLITTLEADIQRLAEQILKKRSKKVAMVVVDRHTCEILSLDSCTMIDPDDFAPSISD